jgi:hypothetical protein
VTMTGGCLTKDQMWEAGYGRPRATTTTTITPRTTSKASFQSPTDCCWVLGTWESIPLLKFCTVLITCLGCCWVITQVCVCMYVCVCMFVYVCIYVYMYICIYVYMYVHSIDNVSRMLLGHNAGVCVCVCVCVSVYVYLCVCVCVIYVYVCVYLYVYIYVCVYM